MFYSSAKCFTHHWVSIILSNTTGSYWESSHNVLLIIGLALFQVILQVVGIISQCFTHHWVSIIPSNTTGSGNHLTMFYSSLGYTTGSGNHLTMFYSLIIGLALFQVILQVVGIISQCFTHHWVSIIPSNTTGSGNHLTMFYSSLG